MSKPPGFVFDVEADGLKPTKIHCLAAFDKSGNAKASTSYDQMRSFLTNADILIGHNIIKFDIPVLERILNIEIKAKLVDTLALSWVLFPDRQRHGLEWWGEDFGIPKPVVEDWDNLPIEVYKERCEEDIKINQRLWNKCWNYLCKLYNDDEETIWLYLDYLSFKLDCARQQEKDGWLLDRGKCGKAIKELGSEYDKKYALLASAMPKVPIKTIKVRPNKPFKKDGSYSVAGAFWFSLLKEVNLPEDYDGIVEVVSKYEEPNPQSNDQIKAWLYSLGWKPETFKYVKEEDGSFRGIEQVRKEDNGEKVLCDSVLVLRDKEPAIDYLQGITVLQHRLSILEGFLNNVRPDGRIQAEIGGFTNTLRMKHRIAVNLPGVDKAYGKIIRGVLIAPEGEELCGADMSALEDKLKRHFIYKYDPEYVKAMDTPGFDPHLDIAITANMMTVEEAEAYKAGDHSKKPIRHKAKTANYSCQYGAAAKTIAQNTGMPLKDAEILHKAYWKRNWSLKKVAEDQIVKIVDGQKWLFNPINKFWYSLRAEKDRFSTLVQGTAAYVFDRWVYYVRSKRKQLTASFHDEIVLCIAKGYREKCSQLLQWAIDMVNEEVKLNQTLTIDIQYHQSYAGVH